MRIRFMTLAAALAFTATHTYSGEAALVWVAGDTCKVNPVSANILEEHYFAKLNEKSLPYYAASTYQGPKTGNLWRKSSVWDGATRRITLAGAANEFVAFQVIVERESKDAAPLKGLHLSVSDLKETKATGRAAGLIETSKSSEIFAEWYLNVSSDATNAWDAKTYTGDKHWYPDPLIPMTLPQWQHVDLPDPRLDVADQKCQAFWIDLYIPHKTPAGEYAGNVTVEAEGGFKETLNLKLAVLPFELPDELSMNGEFNCYNGVAGIMRLGNDSEDYRKAEELFHQMAHAHRCTLNIFPGTPSRRGSTPQQVVKFGFAPALAGEGDAIHVSDWSQFDKFYGKYFSGEAFKNSPRAGVPLQHFYLPFSLSWPSPIDNYFKDKNKYETENVKIMREFDAHFVEKGWSKTEFQILYNGKKQWGEPWNTDEPMGADEYAALRMYGDFLVKAAGKRAVRKSSIRYRVDVGTYSRTGKQLDDAVDLRVVNYAVTPEACWGSMPTGREACQKAGESWWYYANDASRQRHIRVDWSLVNALLWGWAAWDLKTQGFCQWDCMAVNGADPFHLPGPVWNYAQLFYPGNVKPFDCLGPIGSLRLKGMRRGVQDYEYLALCAKAHKGEHTATDAILNKYYKLANTKEGEVRVGAEDPYKMRAEVAAAILAAQEKK